MPQVLLLDEQAVHQYTAAAVARQQAARNPQLMLAPWRAPAGVLYSHRRAGSGLVALAPQALVPTVGTAPPLWASDLNAHPSSRHTALAAKKAGQSVKGAD